MYRVLAVALVLSVSLASAAPTYIWIEAESPTQCNFRHFETSNMGKPQLLSGGEWIMKGMGPKEVKELVPEEGVVLRYDVEAKKAGKYVLWGHIGWFRARADLEWRVGDGEWSSAPADMPTTNLMELGFFCEASWYRLGEVTLDAERTTLEVRFPKTRDLKARMLCALDCFALVQGKFHPEGALRPGETYQSEEDQVAAKQVFELPQPNGAKRVQVKLNGPWQVARYDDPDMDKDTFVPVQELPTPGECELRWMGFDVPGNPWECEPLVFGHRLIYRTRVQVPAAHSGRGFKLHFSGTNWIVSVFVNGRLAGTHRGVWVPWDLDVSELIEPGEANEVAVVVKGTYYALDAKNMGGKTIMEIRNRPLKRSRWTRWVASIYPSKKGDGVGYVYGIVNPVTLVSTGAAYTEDIFIKPSVEKKQLGLELTVLNPADRARTLNIRCEAVNDKTNGVEKSWRLPALPVETRNRATLKYNGPWESPKLWWPQPDPQLHRLRTTISEGDQVLDVHEELFGFREVTVKGPGIYINGVRRNFWNWVDVDGPRTMTAGEWLRRFRAEGNRFMRFSHGRKTTTELKSREERLEFYDRNGVPGRLCTMIDGMFISYALGDRTREKDEHGLPLLKPNEPVWESFREHMAQVAKAYRNHPSVIMYQVENELVYINGMNIYGAYLHKVEELMAEVCDAGRKVDPTRPYSVGGGGDLRHAKGSVRPIEINSPHYPRGSSDWYPENAYTVERYSTKIERWPWTRERPWVVGESIFASEHALGTYTCGAEALRSREDSKRTKARFVRMCYGGYRWAGVAGFFPWDNLSAHEDGKKIFSDLYACPRKQTHRLYGGKENRLLFKVMNDTFSREPVTFEWSYVAGGRRIVGETVTVEIEPGFGKEHTLVIPAPKTARRLDGKLSLKVSQPGAADYIDVRSVPVLPRIESLDTRVSVSVLDRSGRLTSFLRQADVRLDSLDSLAATEGKQGLLIVGPDALTAEEAFGTELLAFAARGNGVIVLEQDVPVAGSNLPAPMRTTTRYGGYAHPQALGRPVFRDLAKDDLIDWAGDHPTYKNAYVKPTQGGQSLVECGEMLPYSALVEMGAGEGVMVLCQLRVGAKLGLDPAADVLLRNLIERYGGYKPAKAVAAVYSSSNRLLTDKIAATGVLHEKVASLEAALDVQKYRAVVVHADKANLAMLNGPAGRAAAFQEAGGWIMLCGVDPEGIDEFNRFVGTKHLLRPFRVERVLLRSPHFPLAATLGDADVALISPKVQQASSGRIWVSWNTFSHVIDGHDAAPFTLPPRANEDPYHYEPTWDDKDPYNFVNGMLSSDFWRYIRQIWIPEEGPQPMTFKLRQPETIEQINIWNNEAYSTIENLEIVFDGQDMKPLKTALPDAAALTEIPLDPPRRVERTITLKIKTWRVRPHHHPHVSQLVGIDNVQFIRAEIPSPGVFIDSVGGLVAFPRGKGGVFLNQIKFMDDEPRKSNAAKKVKVTGIILQNMGLGSATSTVLIPGHNIRYEPIDITDYCNTYRSQQDRRPGWFGRRDQDLRELEAGRRHLANVEYHVVDYATAPVPDCIAVPTSGRKPEQEVCGIKIGRKADVLFFLQAADVRRPITDRERARMNDRRRPFVLPTLAKYRIHYADGKQAEAPVVLEDSVDHWLRKEPQPLMDASLAWSAPIKGAPGMKGVLYSMRFKNPRPDVTIESIDFVNESSEPRGRVRYQNRGRVALLAITVGTVVR